MTYKDKEKANEYHKNYYHDNDKVKEAQKERAKKYYWISKFCKLYGITKEKFQHSYAKNFTIDELKNCCKEKSKLHKINKSLTTIETTKNFIKQNY